MKAHVHPRTLWLPVAALVALAGVLGAGQGARVAAGGETPVIEAMAARWVATAGPQAKATDCHARLADGFMAWLVVACGQGPAAREYHVNRLGWLVRETAPRPPRPET